MKETKRYCCWPSHVHLVCVVVWTGQNTFRMETKPAPYMDHGIHGYHSIFLHLQIEDVPLFDLWPRACVGLYPVEMLEMFFVCLFFFPCECSSSYTVARHKSCCAARWCLIVIYCLNDFHISCYCSRFLLECSRPTTVFLPSMTQDSFSGHVLIGHVATFSGRHALVLLLSLAPLPRAPQLAVSELRRKPLF